MALLALMALLGLTLVLVTAQGRLSALAVSRRGLQPDHDNSELTSSIVQVVAGSNDPNSSFGAHGLLEDLYGLPQFFGRIAPNGVIVPVGETLAGTQFLAGSNNGTLLQFSIVAAQASGVAGLGPQTATQYVVPTSSGTFCGQVITMLTGPAAGQSARVVGYYVDPGTQANIMQVSSFGGIVPNPGDEFMINGRPFAGTGFGLDLTKFQPAGATPGPWVAPYTQPAYGTAATTGTVPLPLLSAVELTTSTTNPIASGMPYAYLPNHARIGLTAYAPMAAGTYWDPAGPGNANEPYDAPDFQNMMLAMHYFHPTLGSVITPIPSLHRPELVGWYAFQAASYGNASISMGNPSDGNGGQNMLAMRRKVILRPEPTDNYFVDANGNGVWDAREPYVDVDGSLSYTAGDTFLDLNGDGVWTPGETDYAGHTFNPITGCWFITSTGGWALDSGGGLGGLDVDNDQDGVNDSIWVDGGLPVHTEADGTLTKNLVAVLCIDLDGKVNLNAHGTLAQLDYTRYPYNPYSNGNNIGVPPNPWSTTDNTGTAVAPNSLVGPLNVSGLTNNYIAGASTLDFNQRAIPAGQGYGPADINPLHLFLLRCKDPLTPLNPRALNDYQVFLQGFDGFGTAPSSVPAVDGRYGETSKLTLPGTTGFNFPGVFPLGSALPTPWSATAMNPSPLTWTQFYLNGPRAGTSQWYDPYGTSLLIAAGYSADLVNDAVALARFSDIRPLLLTPQLWPATGVPFFFDFTNNSATAHVPTGHGSPSDLHSRGFLATDVLGHPYYTGTAILPWETIPSTWLSLMTDQAINLYTSTYPYLPNELVLNDAVDTQYELDLRPNSRQVGTNTGNSINGVSDYARIDNSVAASELEGILRSPEYGTGTSADSSNLVQRLNQLQTAASFLATGSATALKTKLAQDNVRLATTSESWDLPVPNMALTPRQIQDIVQYVDYTISSSITGSTLGQAGQTINLANISLADLARARIYVENQPANVNKSGAVPNFLFGSAANSADLAIFGNMSNTRQPVAVFPTLITTPLPFYPNVPVWPLLAPETILGMRLDVNRILGNGMDDNGNGVVDEPAEVAWVDAGGTWHTESLTYPFSQNSAQGATTSILTPAGTVNPVTGMPNMVSLLDLNNDGFYPPNPGNAVTGSFNDPQTTLALPIDPTFADMRARQLLARHLYVTMMLLLDDRTFANGTSGPYGNPTMLAQIFNTTNPALQPSPSATPLTPREQAAYIIAQWAINVVDFRDRDSIMTPFEFDLYPFRADDTSVASNCNITWNVDDIVGPSSLDDANPFGVRGLVWGCERPELVMTETLATHDRGTADTSNAQVLDASNDPDTLYLQGGPPQDQDWDQVRRPRGSLIVELLNATNPSDAPQRDLQYDPLLAAYGIGQPFGVTAPMQSDVNGNGGYGVNLAQVATGIPDLSSTGPLWSPVWRIAIAYSPFPGISTNEANYYTNSPYTASTNTLDPRVPVLPSTYIHRAVYFTPYQAAFNTPGGVGAAIYANDVLLNRSFFLDPDFLKSNAAATTALGDQIGALMVPPGQYAVVAPACPDLNVAAGPTYIYKNFIGQNSGGTNSNVRQLYMGKSQLSGTPNSLTSMWDGTAGTILPQYTTVAPIIGVPIQSTWLDTTQTYIKHNNSNIQSGTYAANPYGATNTGGQTLNSTMRMSISEPEHGYPIYAQTGSAPGTGSAWDDDAYYQYGTPTNPTSIVAKFPQHPFDSGQPNPQGGSSYLVAGDLPNSYVAPNGTDRQSMTPCYTVIYLQRLANPLNHWDATANPYITVDSMPVDLTAYTGESATAEPQGMYGANPGTAIASFDTRRRGWISAPTGGSGNSVAVGTLPVVAGTSTGGQGVANIWTPLPVLPNIPLTTGQFGMTSNQGSCASPFVAATIGYTNAEHGSGLLPMPWISWNNRPFVSQYELMLVPQSSPSTLVQDFGMLGWYSSPEQANLVNTTTTPSQPTALNEYAPAQPVYTPPAAYGVLPVSQFAHLLNFFNSYQVPTATTTTGSYLPNLYRIFEFLQVPSRYTGTQDMLDPSQFSGNDAVATTQGVASVTSHMFHTPFNWLPRYREPGRINLNTIFDPIVFKCLMDDYPGTLFVPGGVGDPTVSPSATSLWQYLYLSRQGFPSLGATYPPNPVSQFTTGTTAVYPTYFANPFRPDGSTAFVPPTTWNPATPPTPPTSTVPFAETWNYPGVGGQSGGVGATMLRPANLLSPTLALFDDTTFDSNNLGATYASNATSTPPATTSYRHAGQNAMFQYQMFTRLGNTTTNRSNVYAIWVTLGKFQVHPVAVSPQNPDGYKLVAPYLDNAGNQVSTRGFYIFDRSIPMGFQRGQDVNVERGMLVEHVLQEAD
ncbi:MAG TPA: hypothetical protein VG826_20445 [Pirellulales bacterium]|nr:hypothetical protein [Pirellulales bacterium]